MPARPPAAARPPRPGTLVLGVTGLPASGKSTVTGLLAALGAEAADADLLARAALEAPAMARRVGRALGPGVLRRDGSVDRAAVAARVFGKGGGRALRRLESLLHPAVRRGFREAVARGRRRGAPAVVLDAPLLFEAGVDGMCDGTVFVDAPRAVRLRRALARGWTGRELRAREARQWPAPERRALADWVVRNGGSRRVTARQVRALWARALGPG